MPLSPTDNKYYNQLCGRYRGSWGVYFDAQSLGWVVSALKSIEDRTPGARELRESIEDTEGGAGEFRISGKCVGQIQDFLKKHWLPTAQLPAPKEEGGMECI